MGKLRIEHRKRAWLTALLAFLLPGMGHVYNGHYSRGFLLLSSLLLNYTAIFRLANSDGGRHLLLIVYLGMLLPVFYFVSVFDSLQHKAAREEEQLPVRLLHGILLAVSGMVMMILIKPPDMLLPWMNELAELIVGPLLMMLACFIVLSVMERGEFTVFKLGRITSAILILAVGALLLWDQASGSNFIVMLLEWWPILFVVLGIEIILYSTVLRAKAAKLRLDLSGAAAALVVAVTAYSVTQFADFPVRWLDQFNVDLNGLVDYGEEKGYRFEKNVTKVLVDEKLASITIKNMNGDVSLRAGDVDEIELYATVWVDAADESESKKIAEQSTVDVTPGGEIVIESKGQMYGADNNRIPKMNLTVVVPRFEPLAKETPPVGTQAPADTGTDSNAGDEPVSSDLLPTATPGSPPLEATSTETLPSGPAESQLGQESESATPPEEESPSAVRVMIEVGNGSTDVEGLVAEDGLTVKSGDGMIRIAQMTGSLAVQGNSGSIEVDAIAGESSLEMKNGEILAERVTGGTLYATTSNGNVKLVDIQDDVEAETKNGSIAINGANGAVKANTMNGGISVDSSVVGGNWDLDSSVGEIVVRLPELGDYSLYGSVTFGKIESELPFEQIRKTIRGTAGEGTYRIHINATNSITIESRATR
ncbi:DUF4097 family beta strand repeat-containing protein [Paenibacillus sp. LHD-117]|uniref:DUF6677 family protein n=1 Tax=Paenibacillus sp. LHD-117 TaxID=3071412 RepID=UPI0027E1B0F4|nr:DUF6677 family protein [Paenibacillus sp. LHD-117]MDQ6421520.1 DUF4097 family beta strand repeat-containing protein [Paenibacillus sp. LHD-117]